MYVYVAKLKDKDLFKIGSSVNPKQRTGVLDRKIGLDLSQTYACKVGDSYRGIEQKLLDKFSDYQHTVILEQGGNEIFKIECMQDVLKDLKVYGELIEHFYFPVIKSENKTFKKSVKEKHKIACEWLDSMGVEDDFREFKIKINNKTYRVDGFCEKTNTIYEFLGDYWHGNPKLYKNNKLNKTKNITFGKLFNKTMRRIEEFISSGYNVIYIWESDYISKT